MPAGEYAVLEPFVEADLPLDALALGPELIRALVPPVLFLLQALEDEAAEVEGDLRIELARVAR